MGVGSASTFSGTSILHRNKISKHEPFLVLAKYIPTRSAVLFCDVITYHGLSLSWLNFKLRINTHPPTSFLKNFFPPTSQVYPISNSPSQKFIHPKIPTHYQTTTPTKLTSSHTTHHTPNARNSQPHNQKFHIDVPRQTG